MNSTLDAAEAADIENRLLAGLLGLLYAAPGRMMTPGFLGLLEQAEIALFAIDRHTASRNGAMIFAWNTSSYPSCTSATRRFRALH